MYPGVPSTTPARVSVDDAPPAGEHLLGPRITVSTLSGGAIIPGGYSYLRTLLLGTVDGEAAISRSVEGGQGHLSRVLPDGSAVSVRVVGLDPATAAAVLDEVSGSLVVATLDELRAMSQPPT
jgi:hypothetical protein